MPNPTKQALTDGATVDFDEPGVKKRPTCAQQPTVPNTGGARGHLGSRRAKTRMGRHLARRPAWRGVDGRAPSRLRGVPQRLKNAPLGRLSAESDKAAWQAPSHEYGGGDGAVGGGLGGRFVPLPRKGHIFTSQCFPGNFLAPRLDFFFRSPGRVGLLGEVQKPQF